VSPEPQHRVVVRLDRLLEQRGMTLTELAARVDVTIVNLSVLKNGRARAIRFSTLTALCDALGCQPGDNLTVQALSRNPTTQLGGLELPPARES
jgi:putative transcriptional regulator